MTRKNPGKVLRQTLLEKNKNVCCVCKNRGLGLHFHHIDGDSSNTVEDNLAVLCVKDHDNHHRPSEYSVPNHLDLGSDKIIEYKKSWESFVEETKKPNPQLVAMVNIYGNEQYIHSMRLIFQWVNGKVEFERIYHLLDGPHEVWIDRAIEEITWLSKDIKMVVIDSPWEVEYCPDCNKSLMNTLDENQAIRVTSSDWEDSSIASIYINPTNPSLAINISINEEIIYTGHLHKCRESLHYICDNYEERLRVPERAVRTNVTRLITRVLNEWEPANILIGTGDPDDPALINDLILPKCWEKQR
ncbi:HNH endonuclease signature motif containing protein [Paenibacillus chitinolyticus]